jgi:4-amino-4-deoxy-L-arabinose transferase-like glycosyltransferase
MLAKGPIALALPGLIVVLFLAWQRQLACLWDRRLILGACAFAVVALPWYAMVTIETRGAFFRGFFIRNNVERFVAPISDHRGPIYYHPLFLLGGFAPWSVFMLPTAWYAIRGCVERFAATRLLVIWFVSYLVFFSLAATKLPNYTTPLYPALALLTARFLDGWRRGEFAPHRAVMGYSYLWLLILGVGSTAGLLIAGGALVQPEFRTIAGLDRIAWLGGLLLVGTIASIALVAWRRSAAIAALSVGIVGFVAGITAFGLPVFNREKSARDLVAQSHGCRRDQDLRVGAYRYWLPSLVFYAQREVLLLPNDEVTTQILSCPTPAMIFMPRADWEKLSDRVSGRVVASHWDMYGRCEIVAVSNEGVTPPAAPLARR